MLRDLRPWISLSRYVLLVAGGTVLIGLPLWGLEAPCAGDCSHDEAVTVDEVVTMVSIALGEAASALCGAGDRNGDGMITVDEILQALTIALEGCGTVNATPTAPPSQTPTVTPSPTPTSIFSTPTPRYSFLQVGSASGWPGQRVSVPVTFSRGQEQFFFDFAHGFHVEPPLVAVTRPDGTPQCSASNVDPRAEFTFDFVPAGCNLGLDCMGISTSIDGTSFVVENSVAYRCDVFIAEDAPLGPHKLGCIESSESFPVPIPCRDGQVFILAKPLPGTCGDGFQDPGEECDDSNRGGGDGCAANCTLERERRFDFSPASKVTLKIPSFQLLPFRISGSVVLRTGGVTADSSDIPFVIRTEDVQLDPIRVPGFTCLCLRVFESVAAGTGVAAEGIIACGENGLAEASYVASIDHDTKDVDPLCENGSPDLTHTTACNGEPSVEFVGTGPSGSAAFQIGMSFVAFADGGTCAVSPFADGKGEDGVACTGDDEFFFGPLSVVLTTAQASGAIADANSQPGAGLDARVSGQPFDCDALLEENHEGSLMSAALALAFPQIDVLLAAGFTSDIVTTAVIVAE